MVYRNSSSSSISPLRIQVLLVLSLLFSPLVLAKSRRPITDIETRQKKTQCYADIESGLWGWQCKSSIIAKENCVLKCLSPTCYEVVYESDPLEEGEKDLIRGQEFKYCMHNLARNAPSLEAQAAMGSWKLRHSWLMVIFGGERRGY
ncbi:uncharacterized protein LOC126801898 [Argentina anserina]|uniref:uncharacterized protein LOC126801898 n=1 Tax=Argentina anserina TaxID=57926 RepID=UPI00217651EC|nr:uncharacterized protein LOC126801898 [Potentilla anserina]